MPTPVVIVLNDNSSDFNKTLVSFLRENLKVAILKGGLRFDFKIVNKDNFNDLKDLGIKKLPALLVGEKIIMGVPDITTFITNKVRATNQKVVAKSDDELIREFQTEALGAIKKDSDGRLVVPKNDDDEEENMDDVLKNAAAKALAERQSKGMFVPGKKQPSRQPAKQMSLNNDDDDDDTDYINNNHGSGNNRNIGNNRGSNDRDNLKIDNIEDDFDKIHVTTGNASDDAMIMQLLDKNGND